MIIVVYDLRAQNLSFVAPIPEQTGTTIYCISLKCQEVHIKSWQNEVSTSTGSVGWFCWVNCSGMGATNLNSKGPINFRS